MCFEILSNDLYLEKYWIPMKLHAKVSQTFLIALLARWSWSDMYHAQLWCNQFQSFEIEFKWGAWISHFDQIAHEFSKSYQQNFECRQILHETEQIHVHKRRNCLQNWSSILSTKISNQKVRYRSEILIWLWFSQTFFSKIFCILVWKAAHDFF